MKIDNQHRLQIPKFIREKKEFKPGDKIFIVLTEADVFKLEKESEGKIVGITKVDSKGRIIVPAYLKEHFEGKEITFYIRSEEDGVGLILK